MEYISFDKYLKIITKRWKLILYFTIAFISLAIIYGLLFFSPKYKSQCKILLKQENPNTFVTELHSDADNTTYVGQNINPVLTQIEVLNSKNIAEKVAERFNKDTNIDDIPQKNLVNMIQRSIKLQNLPGTSIMEVSVSWYNPVDAQKIAEYLLESYYSYNESLHKKSISSTKSYIEKQLKDTNKELSSVREKIESYRTKNLSINIELEAQSTISKIERIENLISDVNVNISSNRQKVLELSKNLGVDVKKAIDSVAVGQSQSLINLNQTLYANQQKLASFKIKYPETTPQIKNLISEINEVKSQIEKEMISLIGQRPLDTKNSVISDSVRAEMVHQYVQNSIDLDSYLAQKETLQNNLDLLKSNQKLIPEIQKNLLVLQEKEKNLALIAETLNAKLVEANIKDSAIVSNIDVVESPTMPTQESFPTFFHILVIFIFIGILMGISTALGLYYVEDICDGTEELEEILRAPVLGTIPWLTSISYGNLLTDYNPHSIAAIIYQKIAISLKIKCYNKKCNAIALISSEIEKRRSIVAASLANTFAKTEERVFLIDTDFRDSSLTREFNIDFSNYPDITDCILELSKANSKVYIDEKAYYDEIVAKYIIHVPGYENLFLIPNNNKVDNPYEILNNDAFPKLIQILKASFDLVILDTPPILAVADSIITSQHVDGLVVLSGVKACRSNLKKIRKICDDNYVEIFGAIARDTITELEVPENMYIKQLSSKEA